MDGAVGKPRMAESAAGERFCICLLSRRIKVVRMQKERGNNFLLVLT
jgi:hypothetical protein